jgi:hypothetical protein
VVGATVVAAGEQHCNRLRKATAAAAAAGSDLGLPLRWPVLLGWTLGAAKAGGASCSPTCAVVVVVEEGVGGVAAEVDLGDKSPLQCVNKRYGGHDDDLSHFWHRTDYAHEQFKERGAPSSHSKQRRTRNLNWRGCELK